jgi:hypothetical protein
MTDQRCGKTVRDNGRPAQCHRPPGQPWHHAGNTWWLTDWPGGMRQDPAHAPDCTPGPGPIGDFDCCHDGTPAQLARVDVGQVDGHPDQPQPPGHPGHGDTQPERDNPKCHPSTSPS